MRLWEKQIRVCINVALSDKEKTHIDKPHFLGQNGV
jgi:hypothetical protein